MVLSGGVTVAQGPLEAFVLVRIQAGQPLRKDPSANFQDPEKLQNQEANGVVGLEVWSSLSLHALRSFVVRGIKQLKNEREHDNDEDRTDEFCATGDYHTGADFCAQ